MTYLDARLLLVNTMATLQELYRVQAYSTLPLAPVVNDLDRLPADDDDDVWGEVPESCVMSWEDDWSTSGASSTS